MVLFSDSYVSRISRVLPINPIFNRYRGSAVKSVQEKREIILRREAFIRLSPVQSTEKKNLTLNQVNLAERLKVEQLKRIDGQVRAHEQTHMALLNGYARGGPDYIYIIGPDGRLYAVGGSVDVDLRPIPGNPEATIRKARIIRRACYGPMQPSAPDMRVAAATYRLEMEARRELAREETKEEEAEQETSTSSGQFIDIYA